MTIDLIEATLTELERLEREATPGSWKWTEWREDIDGPDGRAVVKTDSGVYPPNEADRKLIIALRNAAPSLIASARALAESRAECERLQRQVATAKAAMLPARKHKCSERSCIMCDCRWALDRMDNLDAVRGRVGK